MPTQVQAGNVMKTAMIVPRGMDPGYYAFLGITAEANGEELLVDRRRRERRTTVQTGVEHRVSDRRGPLPQTWTDNGFLLIEWEG